MRNLLGKNCTENQNTYFMFNKQFFSEKSAICEIMWKNVIESGRLQMAIWRMRIACLIPKATNTFSEHVIRIGFPLQQRLLELASILRYIYIASIVTL